MTIELPADETEAAILGRILDVQNADLSPQVAESWLKLKLPSSDEERLSELSRKAKQGSLTPGEETLLENYLHVGRLMDLMKSKARLSLKKT